MSRRISAFVCVIALFLSGSLWAQQSPGQILELPGEGARGGRGTALCSSIPGVGAAAFDLSGMPIYDRVEMFLKVLGKGAEFQVILPKGRRRRSLRFKPHHGLSKVTRTITRRGFNDSQVIVVRRVARPDERLPRLLLLQNKSGTLMASGPTSFVDRLRELAGAASKEAKGPGHKPKGLKEIYERARFREGPRPPANIPLSGKWRQDIGRLTTAGDMAGLVHLIRKAREKASKEPGQRVQGKPWMGEPAEYHKPSEGELVLSEAGWAFKNYLEGARSPGDAAAYVESLGTLEEIPDEIVFDRYEYDSVDVVGSGRFSYPKDPVTVRFRPVDDLLRQCIADGKFAPIRAKLQAIEDQPRRGFEARKHLVKELEEVLKEFATR